MLVLTERVQNGYFELEHELNGKAKVRKQQTPKLLSCQISIILHSHFPNRFGYFQKTLCQIITPCQLGISEH